MSRVVLPSIMRKKVLTAKHENPFGGHLRVAKTLERVEQRFWWPSMQFDVEQWRKTCVVSNSRGLTNHH